MPEFSEHWQIVNAGGQEISQTPEGLWKHAVQYFKWCGENPIKAKRVLTSGKEAGRTITMEYVRPFTVKAMCIHCGISERYLDDMSNMNGKDSEWYMVIEKILSVIYTQNLEGAMVDMYNPIIVSKVLKIDNPENRNVSNVKVEIVNSSGAGFLANSEKQVLENLDLEKVNLLKDKL